jgi:phosphoribosylamine--glycine ligase
LDALVAVADGEPIPEVEVVDNAVVTVVLASEGYPGNYQKGRTVTIPEGLPEEVVLFHAGTSVLMDDLVTSGGRVMGVSATGSDLASARATAYAACERIEFKGKTYRTDIGA